MVYKLGTMDDLDKLPSIDAKIKNLIEQNIKILDINYGKDRNIDEDDGGYVLFAEPNTNANEVLSWFDYEQYRAEYVDYIDSIPQYCCALYLTSNDFGVVVFTAVADTLKEVLDEIQN